MTLPRPANKLNIGNSHIRMRRLRTNPNIRSLVEEHCLHRSDFIYPIFISEKGTSIYEIPSLPGIHRIPLQDLINEIKEIKELGIKSIMLFPVIDSSLKDSIGSVAYHPDGLIQRAIRLIKETIPEILIFADIALDPYTTHGHDGITDDNGYVLNDETVAALCKQSLSYAACGVDFVCPSDMMDGRVAAIRAALDQEGQTAIGILAYSAKFASAFYGPFRDAIATGARNIDKKTYQLSPNNSREAVREAILDISEGADIIMIKPGLPYLDIVAQVKQKSEVPIAVYQVSGEYSMLKIAAQNNIIDEHKAVYESLIAMKRAGADIIISYYAKWVCKNLL
ncbi:porphobilinogen synthase [Spirobacillus cienkowskii]|uniref:porphobilinogen synthase n=1 Tax=Spirobacillus cienkowskii TaxID=495820 RepID=UPI0030D39EE5